MEVLPKQWVWQAGPLSLHLPHTWIPMIQQSQSAFKQSTNNINMLLQAVSSSLFLTWAFVSAYHATVLAAWSKTAL